MGFSYREPQTNSQRLVFHACKIPYMNPMILIIFQT